MRSIRRIYYTINAAAIALAKLYVSEYAAPAFVAPAAFAAAVLNTGVARGNPSMIFAGLIVLVATAGAFEVGRRTFTDDHRRTRQAWRARSASWDWLKTKRETHRRDMMERAALLFLAAENNHLRAELDALKEKTCDHRP